MTVRKEPKNYAKNVQESRERVLANMAKEKAEKDQKQREGEENNDEDKSANKQD